MFRAPLLALTLLTALLVPTLTAAQCTGPGFWSTLPPDQQTTLIEDAAAIPYGRGNLWEATKNGTTLTILGTMHLPDPRHDATMDRVLQPLFKADLLLVEATLEDQREMQLHMSRNPDLMTITSGPTLPDLVDPETWTAIETAAAARGVPGFMAAKMQPWFLNLTLALPPCAMSAMMRGEAGIDNTLIEYATAQDIPVQPLEPWQDMFDLLRSGTFEEQLDALRLSLVDPALQDALIVSLKEFYFAEETALSWQVSYAMADLIPGLDPATFKAQMAQLEQVLLVDRNASWIPVIEDAAAQNDRIFVGFGAAHLFGESGLLALLEQNGWTITRL